MRKNLAFGVCLMMFMLMPSMIWADVLNIEDVDISESGTADRNVEVSVYFNLRSGEKNVTGIAAQDCSIRIDGTKPKIKKADMISFKDGTHGVGVLFVFPIAKLYNEEDYGIRGAVGSLIKQFGRGIDFLNFITFDASVNVSQWHKASDGLTFKALSEITKESDVVLPNFFVQFVPAVNVFKSLDGISQKYLVIISDSEGTDIGQPERVNQMIGRFTEQLKQNHITPIVVGYSPDGAAAMPNIPLLKSIAANAGGHYFQAERRDDFLNVMKNDVYHAVFGRYIYHAVLDMDKLEKKNYDLQFAVKSKSSMDKANYQFTWPVVKKTAP